MNTRFALRNFSGNPIAFFRVERQDLSAQQATPVSTPAHHILIIDASGSMYYEMEPLRAMVEKVLTLDEFQRPDLRYSLLSYSSSGDLRVHFTRTPVDQIMAPGSKHLQEIRSLRVRGLTCMSQALVEAAKLIDDTETTAISLHTDGYANDRSPSSEARAIDAALDQLRKHPNAFVNCVAYRDWADFNLLSRIANAMSGSCLQANNIRQVYQALYDVTELVSGGRVAPIIEAGIGKADFIAFVSKSAKKIIGALDNLAIRGLADSDDKAIYRYFALTEAQYNASSDPVADFGDEVLAYAKAQLALGNLNLAKYALVAYRDADLLSHYAKALVASDVAEMAQAIEKQLVEGEDPAKCRTQTVGYGLPSTGPSVLSVLGVLAAHRKSIQVHQPSLLSGYQRRGIKKLAGKRLDDGTIEPPKAETRPRNDKDGWLPLGAVEINRSTATANIRLDQKVELVKTGSGEVIEKLAGIDLDLTDYRNYTVVGDGKVTVPSIPIRTSDKRCHRDLVDLGVPIGVQADPEAMSDKAELAFDPEQMLDIQIGDLPLVDYEQQFADLDPKVFDRLVRLTVLSKILNGTLAKSSESLSPEQVSALAEFHITPSLNFSPPTCVPYTDLKEAMAKGEIDSRPVFKIDIGTKNIINLDKLMSGNAYLQRRFTLVGADGKPVDKPTLPMVLTCRPDQGCTWDIKKLSARTKLTAVDEVAYPIYAEALGLEANGALIEVLTAAGLDYDQRKAFDAAFGGSSIDADRRVEILTEAQRQVDAAIDAIYREQVSPLAFYIGSTGLVPDEFGARALTADQLTDQFPEVKLAKKEAEEGTFFVLPNGVILTVYVDNAYFSVERKAA